MTASSPRCTALQLLRKAQIIQFPNKAPASSGGGGGGGGPGSRGGSIVGYTSSGKPIYSHDHEAVEKIHRIGSHVPREPGNVTLPKRQAAVALRRTHKDYTVRDHLDAADHHYDAAKAEPDDATFKRIARVGRAHLHAAAFLQAKAANMLGPGKKDG